MEISKEIGTATGLRPRRPASLYGGSLKVPCLREKCLSVRAIAERWNGMKCRRDAGLIPHRSTRGPLPRNLGAFCGQIAPMVSVLPVVPVRKWHGRGHRFDPDQVHQMFQSFSVTSLPRLCRILVANSKTTARTGFGAKAFSLPELTARSFSISPSFATSANCLASLV